MVHCSAPELKAALLQIRILAQLGAFPASGPKILTDQEMEALVGALVDAVTSPSSLTALAGEAALGLAQIAGEGKSPSMLQSLLVAKLRALRGLFKPLLFKPLLAGKHNTQGPALIRS